MPPARLDVVVLPSKRKHGRLGQGNQEREMRKEWEPRKKQWKYTEFNAYSQQQTQRRFDRNETYWDVCTPNTL